MRKMNFHRCKARVVKKISCSAEKSSKFHFLAHTISKLKVRKPTKHAKRIFKCSPPFKMELDNLFFASNYKKNIFSHVEKRPH